MSNYQEKIADQVRNTREQKTELETVLDPVDLIDHIVEKSSRPRTVNSEPRREVISSIPMSLFGTFLDDNVSHPAGRRVLRDVTYNRSRDCIDLVFEIAASEEPIRVEKVVEQDQN